MTNCVTFALRKMCHEIKGNETGKACGMRGGDDTCTLRLRWENVKQVT